MLDFKKEKKRERMRDNRTERSRKTHIHSIYIWRGIKRERNLTNVVL